MGIARTDQYKIDNVRSVVGRDLVVFAFDPLFSFRYFREIYSRDNQDPILAKLERAMLERYAAIAQFARFNPDILVYLKCKAGSPVEKSIVPKLTVGERSFVDLPNVVLTNKIPAIDLIKQARAVIALNSTTVPEAILARRPVLTPDFGEFFNDKPWNYFHSFPQLFNPFVKTEEIETIMSSSSGVPEQAAQRFVEHQLFSDNQRASALLSVKIENQIRAERWSKTLHDDNVLAVDS